jgi:hypothetical protein
MILPLTIRANPLGGGTHWTQNTPAGNIIGAQNTDIVTLSLIDDDLDCRTEHTYEINGLNKWYFFKNHIIGRLDSGYTINRRQNCKDYITEGKNAGYFIVSETTRQFEIFSTESSWKNAISLQNIKPIIWTRWFEFDDFDSSGGMSMFFLMYFFVRWLSYIGLFALTVFSIFKAIFHKKYLHLIILISMAIILFAALLTINLSSGFERTLYEVWCPVTFILTSLIYFTIFVAKSIKFKKYRTLKIIGVIILALILWERGSYLIDTYPQSI